MTSEKINSFVGDLVAMARAMEERPELERTIANLNSDVSRLTQANNALEDSNNILRSHIDELNAKIGEVTRERDDASFRVLEVEDKAAQALDLCKTLQTGLGQVIAKLEPTKVEPVPMVPTENVRDASMQVSADVQAYTGSESLRQVGGERVVDPTTTTTSEHAVMDHGDMPSSGQSDPLPTSTVESTSGEIGQRGNSVNVPQPNGPYTGKRYMEVPGWIPLSDWLTGGGTEADYHWRAH